MRISRKLLAVVVTLAGVGVGAKASAELYNFIMVDGGDLKARKKRMEIKKLVRDFRRNLRQMTKDSQAKAGVSDGKDVEAIASRLRS